MQETGVESVNSEPKIRIQPGSFGFGSTIEDSDACHLSSVCSTIGMIFSPLLPTL
jgi:hypothetical protein